ncbi:MAG: glycerophosphodiester phosphodiesterase [Oscillospiraceae bacterium]|nr:glycerophosphodiester phosphodiesterase [Oscillospiraceae bacterium]
MDKIIKAAFGGAVALSGLFVLAVQGRTGHPGLAELKKWKYAHRGLHDEFLPENSMTAFRAALEHGYGIELDIHLLKDGNLAVMHDSSLKRTTGCDGCIEDLTTQQLKDYHLGGTDETIPEFRDVLKLFAGKAPLIIELKPERGNHAALAEAACAMMEGYEGAWCMESFDPRCVYWLKKNRPQIIRGQLTEDFFRAENSPLPSYLKFAMKHQLFNFATQPDFIAYKFRDRETISNRLARNFWGVQGVSWTLISREEFDTAAKENWIPIFENFKP